MRFGHGENLDFVLPNVNNYIGNPVHFNKSMAINKYSTADGRFDMFVHHTRYSEDVKSVMRPGAIYITILREPTSLFESIYSFYHFDKKYGNNIIEFIDNILFDKSSSAKHLRRYSDKLGINQMSWDLGLVANDFENIEKIKKHINMIERNFDFIMIFEYFDASLVLFANLMQWPLEKVAYLPLNARNTHKKLLSNYNKNRLKRANMADYMLYNRFLQKFKEKIYKYGLENLKTGIGKLMTINQEIVEKCVESKTNKGYAKTISYKLKVNTNTMCKYFAINELKYTSFLRELQYERHRKYKALDTLMNNN